MVEHQVRVRSCTKSTESDRRSGLVAFLSLEYGVLALDSVVLRRTLDSRYVLAFPQRRDRAGRAHAFVKPISDASRKEIERQVLAQLNVELLDSPAEVSDA